MWQSFKQQQQQIHLMIRRRRHCKQINKREKVGTLYGLRWELSKGVDSCGGKQMSGDAYKSLFGLYKLIFSGDSGKYR